MPYARRWRTMRNEGSRWSQGLWEPAGWGGMADTLYSFHYSSSLQAKSWEASLLSSRRNSLWVWSERNMRPCGAKLPGGISAKNPFYRLPNRCKNSARNFFGTNSSKTVEHRTHMNTILIYPLLQCAPPKRHFDDFNSYHRSTQTKDDYQVKGFIS